MGVKNASFWTEIGLGFGQPSDTPHPHPEFPGIPPPGNSIFPYFTETVPTESRMLQYDLLRNPHRNSKNFQVCQRLGDSCASIVKLVSTYCMLYESRLKIFWMKSMTVGCREQHDSKRHLISVLQRTKRHMRNYLKIIMLIFILVIISDIDNSFGKNKRKMVINCAFDPRMRFSGKQYIDKSSGISTQLSLQLEYVDSSRTCDECQL